MRASELSLFDYRDYNCKELFNEFKELYKHEYNYDKNNEMYFDQQYTCESLHPPQAFYSGCQIKTFKSSNSKMITNTSTLSITPINMDLYVKWKTDTHILFDRNIQMRNKKMLNGLLYSMNDFILSSFKKND